MYCSFTGTYVLRDVAGATYFSRPDKMFVVVLWDRLFIGEVRVKRACANVCGITNSARSQPLLTDAMLWCCVSGPAVRASRRILVSVSPADKGRFRTTATPSPYDTPRAWCTVGCDDLRGVARIALPLRWPEPSSSCRSCRLLGLSLPSRRVISGAPVRAKRLCGAWSLHYRIGVALGKRAPLEKRAGCLNRQCGQHQCLLRRVAPQECKLVRRAC